MTYPCSQSTKLSLKSRNLSLYCIWMSQSGGSQRDVVYLGWPIAPSYMSPNAGVGVELRGLSQKLRLCTMHMEPKKTLEIYSNSIFNQLYLWAFNVLEINFKTCWAFFNSIFLLLFARNTADITAPLPVNRLQMKKKRAYSFNPVAREE